MIFNLIKRGKTLEELYTIAIPEDYNLERIDRVLPLLLETDISRNQIQRLIKESNITVNGYPVKSNYKVKTDDIIEFKPTGSDYSGPVAENIPLEIVYEDKDIAVINKQPGLVVHPGPGNYGSTLVNALLFHIKTLPSSGDPQRPGIVHRLDRDTSGLMVVAKTDASLEGLINQFTAREVEKKYIAVVTGKPARDHSIISRPIGRHKKYRQKMTITEDGREAITEYWVSRIWHLQNGTFSLLEIKIHTGRTHQIRVHMSSIGNPVIGDQIYSKRWEKFKVPYLLLASTYLKFRHPVSGGELSFTAEPPAHITEFIEKLNLMENQ
jgi:23S rRNA pseudouridine1911/1915/1917 synthase